MLPTVMESYDKRMFLCKDRSEYLQYTQVNLFNCAHTRSIGLSSGWNLGKKHRIWPFSINIHSIILFSFMKSSCRVYPPLWSPQLL